MSGTIEIKKELTEVEVEQIFSEFQESIKKQENEYDLGKSFQELVKKITPAKEVHLMIISEPDKILETVTLEKNITIDISSSESMLRKCYHTKEALFSNDIVRDTDYNKEIDNFLAYSLKNLLVVPLQNEEKEILGLIWAGIPQKDWNQYMQSDVKYMMQFSTLNKKMLQKEIEEIYEEIEEKIDEEFQEMIEENIEKKVEEEFQKEATLHQPSSMAKKIKSWFFK